MEEKSPAQATITTKTSRIAPKRMQDYIIVWVDANNNADTVDIKNTRMQLEKVVHEVQLITEPDECIKVIKEFTGTRSFVIASGGLSQTLVPQIHSIVNLESIFIFCGNRSYHESWSKKWTKVQRVETKIDPICQALAALVKQVKNDEISMSFIQTDVHGSTTNLKQLEPSFMYSGLLKDTLLTMIFTSEHMKKMVQSFEEKYKSKHNELKFLNEFSKTYREEKAIWWYTRECFVYNELNQALRDLRGDIIIDMGFFIHDLQRQIEKLHQRQLSSFGDQKFILYRGQGLSAEAFEKAKKSKGGLLGFNCFLSTSMEKTISLGFAETGSRRSGCVGILFVMTIDPSLQMVPFAKIKEHSAMPAEDEILFAMHTIFKIGEVKNLCDYANIFQVSLELTSEDDPRLQGLKNYMAGRTGGCGEHRLAWILNDMGEYDKVEEIYVGLLDKAISEQDKGLYNHNLGVMKDSQGKYEEAINYYEKAMEIQKRLLPENDSNMAKTYGQIGGVYMNMKEYSRALTYYEKALDIFNKTLPKDHPDIATSYNNIGLVCDNMEEYSQALTNYKKSLEIKKKSLPNDHPNIAISYLNIGTVYFSLKQYQKALEYLEEARRIYMISLPQTHPDIKNVINWIANVKKAV